MRRREKACEGVRRREKACEGVRSCARIRTRASPPTPPAPRMAGDAQGGGAWPGEGGARSSRVREEVTGYA